MRDHELKMHRHDGMSKRSWEYGANDSLVEFKEFLNFEKQMNEEMAEGTTTGTKKTLDQNLRNATKKIEKASKSELREVPQIKQIDGPELS